MSKENNMKEWDQLSEREQLLTYISDAHKDAYGFRPRGQYGDDWSVEELRVELDRLCDYANEVYEQEQAAAEEAADEFDALVANTIASGAANREQAIRWLVEAEDVGHDMEFFVWKQGFLFTDRGRALTAELQKMMEVANA